ncbi:hypothetical protein ACFQHN_25845 [Natrialbaceae archaeon GCM10025896]
MPETETTDGPLEPMNIQHHDGDQVRETINRVEYADTVAVGEVDGHEVLVHAQIDNGTPALVVLAGGELDRETGSTRAV